MEFERLSSLGLEFDLCVRGGRNGGVRCGGLSLPSRVLLSRRSRTHLQRTHRFTLQPRRSVLYPPFLTLWWSIQYKLRNDVCLSPGVIWTTPESVTASSTAACLYSIFWHRCQVALCRQRLAAVPSPSFAPPYRDANQVTQTPRNS